MKVRVPKYHVKPTDNISIIASGMSDVEAAAIPVASMTAWHVTQAADFNLSGRRVLIQGAAGGVGGFAVQFAKMAGAAVYATASTTSLQHVRSLGADDVIDYRQQTLEHLTGQIDLVIDMVGGVVLDQCWDLLGPADSWRTFGKHCCSGRNLSRPARPAGCLLSNKPDTARLALIAKHVAAGTLRSTIAEVISLDDLPSAIERNRTGHPPGKIVADLTLK